jgi:hypothetical protein
VVSIDVQITMGLDLQVDQAVTRDLVEHVVEEGHAGGKCLEMPVPSRLRLTGSGSRRYCG